MSVGVLLNLTRDKQNEFWVTLDTMDGVKDFTVKYNSIDRRICGEKNGRNLFSFDGKLEFIGPDPDGFVIIMVDGKKYDLYQSLTKGVMVEFDAQ